MLTIEFFPGNSVHAVRPLTPRAVSQHILQKHKSLFSHASLLYNANYAISHSSPANALLNLTCELKSSQPARSLPSTLSILCSSL